MAAPSTPLTVEVILPWVTESNLIESAVLFGSSARAVDSSAPMRQGDLDLHLVAQDPSAVEHAAWAGIFPGAELCLKVGRPATGGVWKVTAIFDQGQIDAVIVPTSEVRLADSILCSGPDDKNRGISGALNEMATCLHSGYRFLKGEEVWGPFYAKVAKLPGVGLANELVTSMADIFLCDLLWVFEKTARGELVAAQHALHTKLVEVNLRFWRELRKRREQPLPSFGLGRRLEGLASADELNLIRVSARADASELRRAAWQSLDALRFLMTELAPDWTVSPKFGRLLDAHRV